MSSGTRLPLATICNEITTEPSVIAQLADYLRDKGMINDATRQDVMDTARVTPYERVSKLLSPVVTRLDPDSPNYDQKRARRNRENLLDVLGKCGFGELAKRLDRDAVRSTCKGVHINMVHTVVLAFNRKRQRSCRR